MYFNMASTTAGGQLFYGSFIYSKTLEELEYLHDAAAAVDGKGKIVVVERDCGGKDKAIEKIGSRLDGVVSDLKVYETKEGQFFFPGFIGEFYPFCLLGASWVVGDEVDEIITHPGVDFDLLTSPTPSFIKSSSH